MKGSLPRTSGITLKTRRERIADNGIWRYLMACALVAVAAFLRYRLLTADSMLANQLFFCVVLASAFWGGFGPGILATILSGIALQLFNLLYYTAWVFRPRDELEVLFFICAGVVVSYLCKSQQRSKAVFRLEAKKAQQAQTLIALEQGRVLASEQLKDAILNSSIAHIAVLNSRGVIVASNESWRQFGRDEQETNYLTSFEDSADPESRLAKSGIEDVMNWQRPSFILEYPHHGFREDRWFMLIATPLPDYGQTDFDDDSPSDSEVSKATFKGRCGAVVSHIDITERRNAEIERAKLLERERQVRIESQNARRQAEAANLAKDQFLAVTSHELRTPLNSIMGWVQMLRSGTLDEQTTHQGLEVIERSVHSQAQLVSDLLDISSINSGKLHFEMHAANFEEVVHHAVEAMLPQANSKQVTLTTDLNKAVTVEGDEKRLHQVVTNLLHNAIKFSPTGSTIHVELKSVVDENLPLAILIVTDQGIGIDAEALPHIFDSFRQSNSSSTRHYGGMGLGLAIIRHIVHAHRGTIHAASPGENRGATMTVKISLLENQ